jgi:putative membrane protein
MIGGRRPPTGGAKDAEMTYVALALAFLAGVLHVIIFVFESVLWTREPIWRRFKLESQDQAELTRPLAFNQGFYNLFLAVGTFVGVVCVLTGAPTVGWTLIIFGTASMVAAAAVLVSTGRRYARAAATQALLPVLCLLCSLLANVTSV